MIKSAETEARWVWNMSNVVTTFGFAISLFKFLGD